jgi:hypothetical protein
LATFRIARPIESWPLPGEPKFQALVSDAKNNLPAF